MASATAFYSGSFDPLTNGHLDVLRGTLSFAGRVVVGVGIHPGKTPMFTLEEKLSLIREVAQQDLDGRGLVEATAFDGLAIDAARQAGAAVIVRGIRDGTDLDYEMRMAGMNAAMAPDIRTVFVPAGTGVRSVTGTLVRQVAAMGGNVRPFVPGLVADLIESQFAAGRAAKILPGAKT